MAYIPYSPATGDVYWLTSGGVTARFNGDITHADWVGALTNVSGLDSADVRESAEDLVEADGGIHGNFWLGRRPIVLDATVYGHASQAARDAKIDKIMRSSMALRGDAELHWIAGGSGVEMMTWVRRQQPVRAEGAWVKTVQVPLVSQYARLFSAAVAEATGAYGVPIHVENQGGYPSTPMLRVNGPSSGVMTGLIVTNQTTGRVVRYKAGSGIGAGEYVDIDTLNHTATLNNGEDRTGDLDFDLSTWPTVTGGGVTDAFLLTATGGTGVGTSLRVQWRSTWA